MFILLNFEEMQRSRIHQSVDMESSVAHPKVHKQMVHIGPYIAVGCMPDGPSMQSKGWESANALKTVAHFVGVLHKVSHVDMT